MAKKSKEKLRKIKDQAARAMKKGSWQKAFEKYEILSGAQPKDLRLKMKLADILVKLKRNDDAFKVYEAVAEEYSTDGFLIQAVSVYKIILQIDPKRAGVNEKLEELNQKRGRPSSAAKPAAAAPDAEPGLAVQIEKAKQRQEDKKSAPAAAKLPDIPLLSHVGEEEFSQVVSKFQVGTIPRKTSVIKEGTRGDSFFIVASGDVRVFRTHPQSGKKITLAHIKDGGFFGEMALFLDDSVRTASCETAVETVLLRINRKDIEELMAKYPNIKQVMHDFFKKRALDQMLKTMSLLASLEDAEREALIDNFELVEVDPGTALVSEGEEGKYLYVIFSGELEVTTQHEDKGPVKLATLGRGEYFGEISLIQGKMNTADVIASTKCVLFRLPKPVFKELLIIHSTMLDELTQTIEKRLKATVTTLLKA